MERSLTKVVFIIVLAIAFAPARQCAAQAVDTAVRVTRSILVPQKDTEVVEVMPVKPKRFQPNPKKAGLYSSIVPGLGQLYNREYWKVPVVYAGLGIAAYYFTRNLNLYQSYRKAYIGRINNPYPNDKYVGIYDSSQLKQLQGDYSKYLDLTVLFSAIGYSLQVIDAITSAHLKNFDISRDISLHMRPIVIPNGIGMGLVLNFKYRERGTIDNCQQLNTGHVPDHLFGPLVE